MFPFTGCQSIKTQATAVRPVSQHRKEQELATEPPLRSTTITHLHHAELSMTFSLTFLHSLHCLSASFQPCGVPTQSFASCIRAYLCCFIYILTFNSKTVTNQRKLRDVPQSFMWLVVACMISNFFSLADGAMR